MLKLLLTIALALGAVLSLAYAWLFLALGGDYDMHPRAPLTYLTISPKLRAVPVVAQCSPVRYARYYQECAGICGEQQDKSWGTTATKDEVEAAIDLPTLQDRFAETELWVQHNPTHPRATAGCAIVTLRSYNDFQLYDR